MKKNYFYTYKSTIAAIALSLLFCGCAKEVEQLQPQEELHEVVFHAGWAPETKTVLQEDSSVWWSPGDEIALCLTGHEDKYCLKSDCKEPSQETNFIGMIGKNDGEDTFYAIYPTTAQGHICNKSMNIIQDKKGIQSGHIMPCLSRKFEK